MLQAGSRPEGLLIGLTKSVLPNLQYCENK